LISLPHQIFADQRLSLNIRGKRDALIPETEIRTSALNRHIKSPSLLEAFRPTRAQMFNSLTVLRIFGSLLLGRAQAE
jgi:hypothetical protein